MEAGDGIGHRLDQLTTIYAEGQRRIKRNLYLLSHTETYFNLLFTGDFTGDGQEDKLESEPI